MATFSEVSLPLTIRGAGAPLAAPGDIRSNTQDEGRLYVLVLDDFHIGVDLTTLVRETGREFLRRHVQPGDFVAVVGTGGLGGVRREFTADLVRADAAIQTFVGRGSASVYAGRRRRVPAATSTGWRHGRRPASRARIRPRIRPPSSSTAPARPSTRCDGPPTRWPAFPAGARPCSSSARGSPSRREMSPAWPTSCRPCWRRPRGPTSPSTRSIHAGCGTSTRTAWAVTAQVSAAVLADNRTRILRAAMLRELAERTGGAAAVDSNDTLTPLARVAQESSHYYLLGYTPTDAKRDGRFHSVDVRVRRPGFRVAARRGYVAPDDDRRAAKDRQEASGPLADLIRRPVPTAGLSLAAQAVAFPSAADNVAVIVEIAAPDRTGRTGSAEPSTVDLVFQPVGIGQPPIAAVEARLALPSAAEGQAAVDRARVVQRLTLPPGDYQIRIAARESGGAAGAVICELEVPDAPAGLSLATANCSASLM